MVHEQKKQRLSQGSQKVYDDWIKGAGGNREEDGKSSDCFLKSSCLLKETEKVCRAASLRRTQA